MKKGYGNATRMIPFSPTQFPRDTNTRISQILPYDAVGSKGRLQSKNNGYIRVKQTTVMNSFFQEFHNKKYFFSQNIFIK